MITDTLEQLQFRKRSVGNLKTIKKTNDPSEISNIFKVVCNCFIPHCNNLSMDVEHMTMRFYLRYRNAWDEQDNANPFELMF
jgi:hypothetical protein